MSITFRYVHGFKIVERFSGYILASELAARALADYILQKISDFSLDLNYLVSQSYDSASVISGCNSGVQILLKKKCPQAIYVHCSAHRLNLVLVDVAKHVREASDFFTLLQALYVLFTASKCHERFLSIQKASGGREIRLKKLSDNRWSCCYDSIVAFMAIYSSILETLKETVNGSDRNRTVEASGILSGVKTFRFVVSLTIFKKVMGISANLSDSLQKDSLDLGSVASLIQATIDTFDSLRTDDVWNLLREEAIAFARHHEIKIVTPRRRQQRQPTAAMNVYVMTTKTIRQ